MVHTKSANGKGHEGIFHGDLGRSIAAAAIFCASTCAFSRAEAAVVPPSPPPPPPPAGRTPQVVTPPPPPVKPFPLEVDVPSRTEPKMALAGFRGGVFLRDPSDDIRVYVRGRLHLDFHSFIGGGASALEAADGGVLLTPRFFARRARFEVGTELFRRWFALFGLDFGGQPLTNPTGGEALAAPVQDVPATPAIANAYIDYTLLRQFHVMLGQHQAPFSLENRTSNNQHPWMERILPIRAFVEPNSKEIGMTIWGDLDEAKTLSYEFGVFIGDGPNRPQVDAYPDFIGRVVARPFAKKGGALRDAQIGVSGHRGARDPAFVAYEYPAITTQQGFHLWDPQYRDSRGRLVRVLPSGPQNRVGGELRVPFDRFELRAEAYWVDNGTREAVEGLELAHTERLGSVAGVGWYVHASAWPLGDAFVQGAPGFSRPPKLDLDRKNEDLDKRGLEVMAIAAGIQANYDGAARGGDYDAATPGSAGQTGAISIVQLGLGASYWHTKFVRVAVNWLAYHTPGSDVGDNLAGVPGNRVADTESKARASTWMHEIGARLGVNF